MRQPRPPQFLFVHDEVELAGVVVDHQPTTYLGFIDGVLNQWWCASVEIDGVIHFHGEWRPVAHLSARGGF